jgi:threonine dehydratase
MRDSWLAGSIVRTDSVDTIADGIAVRNPVPLALESMRRVVDDMLLVDDTAIARAMLLFRDELDVTLEPAGAVAVAAALSHRFADGTVAFILTGANVEVV